MKKIGIISLGCAKNLVDSEEILGMLHSSNFQIVNNPNEADAIIVNTCGFINSSKQESIDTILEMSQYHKKLIVVGCLVERYLNELKEELPEVDLFVPIKDYGKIHEHLIKLFDGDEDIIPLCPTNRVLSTPPYTSYLRISDGCNNRCTFCAIPLIRGNFKSRSKEEILKEAEILSKKDIKELVVISQDTTRYGTDLENESIVTLLKDLLKYPTFAYIRLLYLYPDEVSDELIELISKEERLTSYFDLPIQHINDRLLKNMNRRGDKKYIIELIKKIRSHVPNAVLRTTLIVGFPGETEDDFEELLDFVKETKFDHLGAFTYSREEGTKSYDMGDQVEEIVKQDRLNRLMKVQRKISYELNKSRVGEIMHGIVTKNNHDGTYDVRSGWNAPDDIDGRIILKSEKMLSIGDLIDIRIIDAFVYDLLAELI